MFDSSLLTVAQQDGQALPPPPPPSSVSAAPGQSATTQQVASGENQPLNTAPAARSPFGDPLMLIALAVLAFMFFFTISSSRKEKKKRAAMAASLKKGSRVRTIGGIIGTVAEVRDDNTVVIKVDENANTRIKFDKSAVAAVLEDKGD